MRSRKLLSLVVAAALLTALLAALPTAVPVLAADAISTPEDLLKMSMSGNYVLTNDIVLTEELVKPLGQFSGTLDGQGYGIYGVQVFGSVWYIGLFSAIRPGAVVENLIVVTTEEGVGCEKGRAGILCGELGGTVRNCAIYGNVYSEAGDVGGITSMPMNIADGSSPVIEDCYVEATVTGYSSYIGGVVGVDYANWGGPGTMTIRNTVSNCDIISKGRSDAGIVGGIISGAMNGGPTVTTKPIKVKIENCRAEGSITARKGIVGGIMGTSGGSSWVTVSGCAFTGVLRNEEGVGCE
ncbi:MAG: hypothetical protein FWD16_06220, partial [Clostridia bacterium]|nr:hypothetical protein [Clostridia bacterium]